MKVVVIARYICKSGTRAQMMEEIKASDPEGIFRAYPENLAYKYSLSATDPDAIDLCDMWATEKGFERHLSDPVCKVTAQIREKYVIDRQAFILQGDAYKK